MRAVQSEIKTENVSIRVALKKYLTGEIEVSKETHELVPEIRFGNYRRWERKLRCAGVKALMPQWGNRRGSGVMDSDRELHDGFLAIIRDKPHLSIKAIWRELSERYRGRVNSYGRFYYWFRGWKTQHPVDWQRHLDPERARARFMPSIGTKADEVTRPGQIVEIDISPCDLFCTDGRHYLIVAIDVYSRRWVALIARNPSAVNVLRVLRKFCRLICVPEKIRVDNGQEFKARAFRGACANLEIAIDFVAPFSGWLKPFVERLIGSIQHGFFPLRDGYIGANVAERSAIEARHEFAKRLGETRNERFDVRFSAFQVQQQIDVWAAEQMNKTHSGLGESPNDRFRAAVAAGWIAPRVPDRALDVLLADAGTRVVGKKGLRYENCSFWSNVLIDHLGRPVRIFQSDDMGELLVFSPAGEFICVAYNPERAGLDRRGVAISAGALWRQHQREARKAERGLKAHFRPERIAAAIVENRSAGAPLTPVELANLPLLEAATEAAAARKNGRPAGPPVQTASSSDRRWKEYLRLEAKAPDELTDDEKTSLRVYKSSAAFAARTKFGAVA